MGVKGLTTFINQHQNFFESYNLHSSKLVIDAYGLMSNFYFDRSIDPGNHGGEFQKFYNHCCHFYQNLDSCGIEPYLVFDGGYDMDGKKFETLKERCQQKISSVKSVNNGGHAFLMPILTSEVFKQAIRDFQVHFVFSDFEADRDIAVLANEFQCPVLGQDSDFFIMNIHNGYIPFDRLEWMNLSSLSQKQKKGNGSQPQKKQNFIRCQRYKLSKFCGYFQVESCLMPLFASVSGNDYLQSISLKGFFSATKHRHNRRPDRKPHPRHKGNSKFCEVLHHLTFYTTYQECLEEVIKHVHPPERSRVKQALCASCDMYEVTSHSPVVTFFRGGDSDQLASSLSRQNGIPRSFLNLLHKGEVPTMCLNIYLNRMYFVGTQVEQLSEVRSSLCALQLMRALIGVMLIDVVEEYKSRGETLTVDIYDREGMHVKCFKVEPLCEVEFFGTMPSFRRVSSLSKQQRCLLLLCCLEAKDLNIANIPEPFQLVLAVTVFWFRHAQPQVPYNLLLAMVVSWIQGVAWCQHNATLLPSSDRSAFKEFDSYFHWHGTECTTVLHNFHHLVTARFQKSLNLSACHGLAQWVSCARLAECINAVLLHVFPRANMAVLFNGLLLHNLYHSLTELHPSHHPEFIDNQLLSNAPNARDLFQRLMDFFSHHLGFQWMDAEMMTAPQHQHYRGHHRGGGRGGRNRRGGRGGFGYHGNRGRGRYRKNPGTGNA